MSNEGKTKMSMGQRLAYSFGAFGNDAFYGLLSGYLIMFITSHLFNSGNQAVDNKMISLVTLIIMALRIVELFIDPFIGNAIDRTKTRWGHFRPWVVAGGTGSAVLLLCLFTSLGNLYQKNAMLYLVIFAVMYITMDIFFIFANLAVHFTCAAADHPGGNECNRADDESKNEPAVSITGRSCLF